MEADTGGAGADAEHAARLGGCEPLPRDEGEELAVVVAELRQRGLHVVDVRLGPGSRRGAQVVAESVGEPVAPELASARVGDHPPGHAEEPVAGLPPARHRVELAPRDQEGLGERVGGVLGGGHPPDAVPQHDCVLGVEEGPEPRRGVGIDRDGNVEGRLELLERLGHDPQRGPGHHSTVNVHQPGSRYRSVRYAGSVLASEGFQHE